MTPRIFSILILGLFASCADLEMDEKEKAEIIEQGVKIQIAEFHKKHDRECIETAVTIATKRVDSLVREGELIPRVDPVVKPPKPDRPDRPVLKYLPDSINHGLIRDSTSINN